jgi:hypothetical protein
MRFHEKVIFKNQKAVQRSAYNKVHFALIISTIGPGERKSALTLMVLKRGTNSSNINENNHSCSFRFAEMPDSFST